jgi:hypothetical protein
MVNPKDIEAISKVRARHESEILAKKNVVGLGIGFREQGGVRTDELALVVFVSKKVPATALAPQDRIPSHIEGIPTDIKEVGIPKAW